MGVDIGGTKERYSLDKLIEKSNHLVQWSDTEWGFPKGRRNYQEDDRKCALREFEEETGEYPLITPGQFWKKFKTNFCDFIQDRQELVTDIGIQAFKPIDIRHDQIVDNTVVGFGNAILNLEELFAIDVGPNVLLAVDNALLKCAIDL